MKGVLLMAYGTPERPVDVEAYYTHIRGGRVPSPDAVARLQRRYELVGGRTPLLDITTALARGLERALHERGDPHRVYVGMKHWHPFIGDVIPRIAADGVTELTAIALAPHYSRMSIGGYQNAVRDALSRLGSDRLRAGFVDSWHLHPLFIDLIATRARETLDSWPSAARPQVVTVFSAHSLPERIRQWNDPYERQLLESCHAVAERARIDNWRFAWQSAGETGEPWLGPDICEVVETLHGDGVRDVLSVPIGFVSDHLEIFYDIDHEARGRAEALGMTLRRTPMPNADREFARLLAVVAGEALRAHGRSGMGELIVGTRGSALALAQTRIVCDALTRAHPGLSIRVERITTTGDARADVPLSQLGRGVFVSEIEAALRGGRVDFAVHSAKDMPSTLPDDLVIAAFLPRADARDVVVSPFGRLRDLPRGARVGTSSPRRACLLRALRPDLEPVDVRGNVDTRLRKLREGEFDALILAAAGLIRLGRESEITEWLDASLLIPSVGQGALAIEARADDTATIALLRVLDDRRTRVAVAAERAFLAELGAGCRAAAAAHATVRDGETRLSAFIGATDGRHVRTARSAVSEPFATKHLGQSVARELICAGGAAFLARTDSALRDRRVAVTRALSQATELFELLRANGAEPVLCPTIDIVPPADAAALDGLLAEAGSADWIVFTSANAVTSAADRVALLPSPGALPARVRVAAIGDATAGASIARFGRVDFVPSRATAEVLAREIPLDAGSTVLVPHGELAATTLADGLAARGARVVAATAYRTVPGPGAAHLARLVREDAVDAIVFTSPSTLRFAATAVAEIVERGAAAPVVVCIGPTTSAAAREAGLTAIVEAYSQTVGGIVEALERALAGAAAQLVTG